MKFDKLVGEQLLGFPGSEILKVIPTCDYLTHGPVGDGWYDPAEGRYVTTDFHVLVRLADGREVLIPKSYRNLSGAGITAKQRKEVG